MIEQIVKYAKQVAFVKWFRQRFPLVFLYLVIKPLTFFRYKNEKAKLQGRLEATSTKPSVLLFTTHKCASTYTTRILSQITSQQKLHSIDIEAYFSVKDINPEEYFSDLTQRNTVFEPSGFYYGPLRYYYSLDNLSNYKAILVLRDPRDVLTSFYYSKKYSHIVISEGFYKDRNRYANHTIDEFVLDYLPEIQRVYSTYIEKLLKLPNLCVLPYEMMVSDFPKWLEKLVRFLDYETTDEQLINQLIKTEAETSGSGSKTDHIRSKQPGDYLKQLKPETIQILNESLADELEALGYS